MKVLPEKRDRQPGSVRSCEPKLPHFSFNPTAVWTAPRGLAMWGELKLRGGNSFVATLKRSRNCKAAESEEHIAAVDSRIKGVAILPSVYALRVADDILKVQ